MRTTATTPTTGRRFALLLAAAAMLLAMLPTAPANAGTGLATVIEGEMTLDQGFGVTRGTGSLEGTAYGVHGTDPMVGAEVTASFTHNDPLISLGDAYGTINIGPDTCGFHWFRTGNTANVTFSAGCTGHAVLEFVPLSPPGSAPAKLAFVGEAAWTH